MEHIIQFGITIDDERIKSSVESAAVKELAGDLKAQIFSMNRWTGDINGFNAVVEDIVKDVFAEHKDEIIRLAAELVADSMKHSKVYREKLKELANE